MKAPNNAVFVLVAALVLAAMSVAPLALAMQDGTREAIVQAKQAYGRLPMSFERNQGQTDEQVRFLSRGSGYNLFFTRDETVLVLRKGTPPKDRPSLHGPAHLRHAPSRPETASVVRMKFLDANSDFKIEGTNELPGKKSYFHGRDKQKWQTDVPQYSRVEYRNLYPGVDLVYYGNGAGKEMRLEHDFVVRPGSDPTRIRLGFEGVERVEMNSAGDLVLRLPDGSELIQHAPLIYQESDGGRKPVAGGYTILPSGPDGSAELPGIGFRIAEYDSGKTLYIDPLMSYSTYLGGSEYDFGYAIAVDSTGIAYVTGWTYSSDFPAKKPLQASNEGGTDLFVAKLNAAGSALLYSTCLGGSGDEFGLAIATNGGVAYITGYTDSTDLPITSTGTAYSGLHDAFVLELSVNAISGAPQIAYLTYLGGTGEDYATGIAVDSAYVYVTGYTDSTAAELFPVTTAAYQADNAGLMDVFVAKIDATGVAYATYIGGGGEDYATGIAVDSAGLAYVTGYTNSSTASTEFPTSTTAYQTANAGGWDAFAAVLLADGSDLSYSTYVGGAGDDFAYGIAISTAAESLVYNAVSYSYSLGIYITGSTSSSDFPVTSLYSASSTAYQTAIKGNYDAFVSKLVPEITAATQATLAYSTYLGGEDFDAGNGVAVDSTTNDAYVIGETWSEYFPVGGSPFQGLLNGLCDAFITKLHPASSGSSALTYSSYLGGANYDAAIGLAMDALTVQGVYLVGYTYSTDFPILVPVAGNNAGNSDAFITKIISSNASLPDLIVKSITTSSTAVVGQKIMVANSVKNKGSSVSAPCKVGLYLSATTTTTPSTDSRNVFLASRSLPKLKKNATSAANTKVLIPPTVAPGIYYLVASADNTKLVDETLEDNNTASKQITVYAARPDLIALSVSGPLTAEAGQTIKIVNAVKNQGYRTAKHFSCGIYLSTDSSITTSDTLIGSRVITTLAAGKTSAVSVSLDVPSASDLPAGTYYFGLIADPGNTIIELNDTNNSKVGNKIVISSS